MAALKPVRLISSDEPKAIETAKPIAEATGLDIEVDRGVREHDRTGAKYLPSDDWRALVIDSLRRPEELVLGAETTGDAGRRFGQAVSDIASRSDDGDVVIVSHGAAMSAFLAQLTGLDVVEIWQRFGLPGYLVVKWPEADGIEEEWRWEGSA